MRHARTRRHPPSIKRGPQPPTKNQAVPKGRPLEEFRTDLIARIAEMRTPPAES